MPLLPPGMPAPPSFRKFNPADQPIYVFALTSNTVPMSTLDDYAENARSRRASRWSAASSQVQVQGAQKYAVRVQVDPDKLQAQQIGLNEVDQRAPELERQPADRAAVRPDVDLQHQGERPADERGRLPADRRRVPPRRAGPPAQVANVIDSVEDNHERVVVLRSATGGRARRSRCGQRQPGSNTHRGHRRDPRAAAGVPGAAAAVGASDDPRHGSRRSTIRAAFNDIQMDDAADAGAGRRA